MERVKEWMWIWMRRGQSRQPWDVTQALRTRRALRTVEEEME